MVHCPLLVLNWGGRSGGRARSSPPQDFTPTTHGNRQEESALGTPLSCCPFSGYFQGTAKGLPRPFGVANLSSASPRARLLRWRCWPGCVEESWRPCDGSIFSLAALLSMRQSTGGSSTRRKPASPRGRSQSVLSYSGQSRIGARQRSSRARMILCSGSGRTGRLTFTTPWPATSPRRLDWDSQPFPGTISAHVYDLGAPGRHQGGNNAGPARAQFGAHDAGCLRPR